MSYQDYIVVERGNIFLGESEATPSALRDVYSGFMHIPTVYIKQHDVSSDFHTNHRKKQRCIS